MTYNDTLPGAESLLKLARKADFPIDRDGMIILARKLQLSSGMINFLRLFSLDDTFESRIDFINQCEELKMLIIQELEAPREYKYSNQD